MKLFWTSSGDWFNALFYHYATGDSILTAVCTYKFPHNSPDFGPHDTKLTGKNILISLVILMMASVASSYAMFNTPRVFWWEIVWELRMQLAGVGRPIMLRDESHPGSPLEFMWGRCPAQVSGVSEQYDLYQLMDTASLSPVMQHPPTIVYNFCFHSIFLEKLLLYWKHSSHIWGSMCAFIFSEILKIGTWWEKAAQPRNFFRWFPTKKISTSVFFSWRKKPQMADCFKKLKSTFNFKNMSPF